MNSTDFLAIILVMILMSWEHADLSSVEMDGFLEIINEMTEIQEVTMVVAQIVNMKQDSSELQVIKFTLAI